MRFPKELAEKVAQVAKWLQRREACGAVAVWMPRCEMAGPVLIRDDHVIRVRRDASSIFIPRLFQLRCSHLLYLAFCDILQSRTWQVVVSALAILTIGGVYVPCDDRLPWPRVQCMAEDAGVTLILAGHDDSM